MTRSKQNVPKKVGLKNLWGKKKGCGPFRSVPLRPALGSGMDVFLLVLSSGLTSLLLFEDGIWCVCVRDISGSSSMPFKGMVEKTS